MADQILDGKGKGFLAQVNSDGQLETRSESVNAKYIRALTGDTYGGTMKFTALTGGIFELMGYFIYTGSRTLVFSDFAIMASSTGFTHFLARVATIPIAGGTDALLGNTNTASSKTLSATFTEQADGAAPYTVVYDGVDFLEYFMVGGGTMGIDTRDAILLRPNLSLGFFVKTPAAGVLCRQSFTCYEVDI